MAKALIAYSYDKDNPTLLTVNSVPSELFIVKTWAWQLLLGDIEQAVFDQPLWKIDFTNIANGTLETAPYRITLTVTDSEDRVDQADLIIGYNKEDQKIGVFLGIWDQVMAILGESGKPNNQEYLTFRNTWQNSLGPALSIDPDHYHQEAMWDPLQNTLIAYLVARDYVQASANRVLVSVGSGGGSGLVKRIETGPVNTEWFDSGSLYADIFKPGGLWEDLLASVCGIASIVGVYIRGCDDVVTVPPIVLPKSGDYAYEEQYIIAPQFTKKLS